MAPIVTGNNQRNTVRDKKLHFSYNSISLLYYHNLILYEIKMDFLDWTTLLFIICWCATPLISSWIQIVLLFPTIDRTIYFHSGYSEYTEEFQETSRSKRKSSKSWKSSRDSNGPRTRHKDAYQEVSIDETFPEQLDSRVFVTIDRQKWMRIKFIECLIFSRVWYRKLSDISGILIPLPLWFWLWILIWVSRVVSNFFIWYDRTEYPEPLFALLVIQIFFTIAFEIVWFPLIFKIRCTVITAIICVTTTCLFLGLYGARAAYDPGVGFGFMTVELLYYGYLSWFTLIIAKEEYHTQFTDTDLRDIAMKPSMTVLHSHRIHESIPDNSKLITRDISRTLGDRKSGFLPSSESKEGEELLVRNGLQSPTPSKGGFKLMGWFLTP